MYVMIAPAGCTGGDSAVLTLRISKALLDYSELIGATCRLGAAMRVEYVE